MNHEDYTQQILGSGDRGMNTLKHEALPESSDARFLLVADHDDGEERYYCRDEAHVEQQLLAVLFGPAPTDSDRGIAKVQAAQLFRDGIANTDGAFDVVLHRLG